jgi:nitrite reductase (NADH) small subunit
MSDIKYYPVADIDSIPLREGRKVSFERVEVALFRVAEEEFLAIGNRCPHKAGPLAEGIVCGRAVTCPLHNNVMCLDTGHFKGGEKGKVKTYPVKVEKDKVYVAFESGSMQSLPEVASKS